MRTHPEHEEKPPAYILREADLREMARDGTIDRQHFLIRLLAANLRKPVSTHIDR